MPNRVIKESAFTSERIASLSDFEFRLWVGMITQADDMGRGDARPAILKGRLFALRDRLPLKDIEDALQKISAAGCVSLYTVDGKPYYQFRNWANHQRIRNARKKLPGPEDADDVFAANCGELRQDAASGGENAQGAASCGPIQSNPIQSESNPIQSKSKGAERAERSPLETALDDFAKHRKAMKKPLTEKARELTIAELEKLAPGDVDMQVAILNQSIQRGWQGVFALKEDAEKSAGKGETSAPPKAAEPKSPKNSPTWKDGPTYFPDRAWNGGRE